MIQGSIFKFTVTQCRNCQIYRGTAYCHGNQKSSNFYTECVIYENEPSHLAWIVNFEKCNSVTQRPLGHIET